MRLNNKKKGMLLAFKNNPFYRYNFLGDWIFCALSWSHHVHHITSEASRILYYIRRLRTTSLSRSWEDLRVFHKIMVPPILE